MSQQTAKTTAQTIIPLPGAKEVTSVWHENALCGSVLHHPELFVTADDILSLEDFSQPFARAFWSACQKLILEQKKLDRGVIASMVAIELAQPEADAHKGVTMLLSAPGITDNAEHYARVVTSRAQRVRIQKTARELEKLAGDLTLEPNVMIDKANSLWFQATEVSSEKPTAIKDSANRTLQNIKRLANVTNAITPMGFSEIDSWSGGVKRGTVNLIVGNNGAGKTQFLMSTLRNVSKQYKTNGRNEVVLFVTLEMSENQINQNLITMETGLWRSKMDNPATMKATDWDLLGTGFDEIKSWNHHVVDDQKYNTVEAITRKIRMLQTKHDVPIVIIDGLWLLKNPYIANTARDGKPTDHYNHTGAALPKMAKALNVGVLIAHQYNGDGKQAVSTNQTPQLFHVDGRGYATNNPDFIYALQRQKGKPTELHPIKGRGRDHRSEPFKLHYSTAHALYEQYEEIPDEIKF